MSRPVRIGFIGAGGNTRARHLPGFKAIPGVELVAVCNRTKVSGESIAREFGLPVVAENWQQLMAAPEIDAICIGTWPNLHAPLVVAALQAGKHVLTEARMARDLTEAQAMLAESRRHPQLVAQIVPAPMSLPFDATVINLLQDGTLGAVREVFLTGTTDALADSTQPLSWRQDSALSGKNTLYLGIYYEMMLRWLGLGVSSVVAAAAIHTRERPAGGTGLQPTTVPESVTVLGTFAPGLPGTGGNRVALDNGARLVAHFSGVELAQPRSEICVNGTKAGLRLDLARQELWLATRGEAERRVEIAAHRRGAWNVETDFIASIRDGRPVTLTDFATGVEYMRFTDAVWESWNSAGARVAL